jgi:predicted peptidase
MKLKLYGVAITLMLLASQLIAQSHENMLKPGKSNYRITKTIQADYQYLLFLPDAKTTNQAKFPLILFLHGSGERGDSLNLVKKNGIPSFVETYKDFPFALVVPQCPEGEVWDADRLMALLEDVQHNYPIDDERIYVTGLSMGGFGTWDLACRYPEKFAAIAPVCGGGSWLMARKLKNMPIWAFHGAKDDIVLPIESERMVKAVNEEGGSAKLTLYPEANHNSWTETYNNPELYTWFLANKKKKE